ncbi:hypothetical protein D9V37_16290 [Nocardioides mangrovicus]|uniref:Uncharacterized protein n=1 Tax=Nocardioides mangrovicus TaxID=2478913 RepID=A0A3L8NYH8_9ACTN|nr:hypothetical protein [Nocardioides mangrovicus]RLV47707.1 hypothetical protein D9V37_16290 [Nocardioides mangrovicus]
MPLFSRRPRNLVPQEIVEQLNSFGNASWEAKLNSETLVDDRFNWPNFFARFLPAYQTDLARSIAELHAAAGADGLARYGGYRLVAEFDAACEDPNYLEMMDAALDLMYEHDLSSIHLTGYERDRWMTTRGDVKTTFDRIVEVELDPRLVSGLEIEPGQRIMLALMGPKPLDNQFWIERREDSMYEGFSMRQWDSDAGVLTRCEEKEIGSSATVEEALASLGRYLRRAPYWAHSALDPFFPEKRETSG